MKVILDYDAKTGYLTDKNGVMITSYMGLQAKQAKPRKQDKIDSLVKLKAAGFTADEILSISAKGLV